MKAIEVWRKGEKLFTAGLADGIVTAKLVLHNQVDPIWFDVTGRDRQTGGHINWSHIDVNQGDEFTLRLVEIDASEL